MPDSSVGRLAALDDQLIACSLPDSRIDHWPKPQATVGPGFQRGHMLKNMGEHVRWLGDEVQLAQIGRLRGHSVRFQQFMGNLCDRIS